MNRSIAPTLAMLALAACSESSTAPLVVSPERLQLSPTAPFNAKGAAGIEGDNIVVFRADVVNPLAKAESKLIKKDDIDGAPKPSPVSIMPKGLLDKLTKDEILDVLAYVWSKADPKHKYFQGGHDHKHGH